MAFHILCWDQGKKSDSKLDISRSIIADWVGIFRSELLFKDGLLDLKILNSIKSNGRETCNICLKGAYLF